VSTWPYIIVELDLSPISCAVLTISTHSDVGSLPLGCYLLELNSENQRWNARFCP
jgi:hypothetical protein